MTKKHEEFERLLKLAKHSPEEAIGCLIAEDIKAKIRFLTETAFASDNKNMRILEQLISNFNKAWPSNLISTVDYDFNYLNGLANTERRFHERKRFQLKNRITLFNPQEEIAKIYKIDNPLYLKSKYGSEIFRDLWETDENSFLSLFEKERKNYSCFYLERFDPKSSRETVCQTHLIAFGYKLSGGYPEEFLEVGKLQGFPKYKLKEHYIKKN